MTKPHRKAEATRPGWTLIELLTIIAIIGVLIGILLPSLSAAREMGRRVKCAANLHNISLAMAQYANEYDGCYPAYPAIAGQTSWNFVGCNRQDYAISANRSSNLRSIFLLLRGKYVVPEQFICPSLPRSQATVQPAVDIMTGWDFGTGTGDDIVGGADHCSYSYQNVLDWPLRLTSDSGLVVLADRNPLLETRTNDSPYWRRMPTGTIPDSHLTEAGVKESANSFNHGGVGQNVLYIGGHVKWTTTPLVGLTNSAGGRDNIYTRNNGTEYGEPITTSSGWNKMIPTSTSDSWLVP